MTTTFGLRTHVQLPYRDAVARVREELAEEGFGIITEIDVRETFREKLDLEFRPYVILGACNPSLAHEALKADLDIGLLLPCNVIVYQADQAERAVVSALDPEQQLGISGNEALKPLAEEVRSRLERVVERVST